MRRRPRTRSAGDSIYARLRRQKLRPSNRTTTPRFLVSPRQMAARELGSRRCPFGGRSAGSSSRTRLTRGRHSLETPPARRGTRGSKSSLPTLHRRSDSLSLPSWTLGSPPRIQQASSPGEAHGQISARFGNRRTLDLGRTRNELELALRGRRMTRAPRTRTREAPARTSSHGSRDGDSTRREFQICAPE